MKRDCNGNQPELDHVQVLALNSIIPAPENENVYRPIAFDDPEIRELAKSIKMRGVLEPLLISRDGFIISGHRRRIGSLLAGLKEVPVKIHPISRKEDLNGFLKLLVEANSQRIKNVNELLHESAIKIDPKTAHDQIVNERVEKQKRNRAKLSVIAPVSSGQRFKLSKAKMSMVIAINNILEAQRDYWPLSARQVHYRLLGPNAPLIHASKPNSR
jgi:hypothetical protein